MPVPKLIIVGGSVATGKTSISKALAEATGIRRVSKDEIKEALFDVGGYFDRPWSKEVGNIAWPVFKRLIEMYLERGESVIGDAVFNWPEDGEWLQELADRHGADFVQIWLTADPQVARARFLERANSVRHCGHCDALECVMDEFDQKYFNRSFIPHPISARTLVVETTDMGSVNHEAIYRFVVGETPAEIDEITDGCDCC